MVEKLNLELRIAENCFAKAENKLRNNKQRATNREEFGDKGCPQVPITPFVVTNET